MTTECCVGGHPATRRVYPFLDYDDGALAVCDNDEHIPIPADAISEIEPLLNADTELTKDDRKLLARVIEDDHFAVLKATWHMEFAVRALHGEEVLAAREKAQRRFDAFLRDYHPVAIDGDADGPDA